jgi:hypothetical protein
MAEAAVNQKPLMVEVDASEIAPGEKILIRRLDYTASEALDKLNYRLNAATGKFDFVPEDVELRYCMACACDAEGNRLFAPADEEWLRKLPATLHGRIYQEAKKLNNFSVAVEGAGKNLPPGQNA